MVDDNKIGKHNKHAGLITLYSIDYIRHYTEYRLLFAFNYQVYSEVVGIMWISVYLLYIIRTDNLYTGCNRKN